MPEPGVEVVWSALSRAWRKAEYEELWLQFRPRGSKDVFDAVEAAVQVANQEVEDAGWGGEVFTGGVSDSDAGPVALMSRTGPEQGVRAWLDAFARHLQALGKAGRVTAAPEAFFPEWLNSVEVPQLTAFVSYQTDDRALLDPDEQRRAWHVPAPLTAKIAEAGAAWGRFDRADVYLLRNIHQTRMKNANVGPAMADAAAKFAMARVTYLQSEPRRLAWASLGTLGRACYGVMDDTVSWQDRLGQVVQAMVAFPRNTDLAFVQYSHVYTLSWSALDSGRPLLPYVEEYHIRYNRHLNARYIPDAHGLQLLTDAHLAHANDLSDWIIEPLGGGRHVVQAKDLEPWYANIDPDPETLAKARADFGGMILTKEIIADNPPPWRDE